MEDSQATPDKKPEDAKPAEKAPKPKVAAKKEKPAAPPLVDNGDGTVTDPNSGLMWKKSDAWLDMHRFYTWMDHREYVDKFNKEKFAGYDNWRIPSKAEAATIFDKTKECMDKNGTLYSVDPIFEAGGASNTWISECSDDNIIRYDFKVGVDTPYPTQDVWATMRLLRKEGEAAAAVAGQEADGAEANVATADSKEATAEAKPAAPKPAKASSGNNVPGATPRYNRSPEEKDALIKRARAHAADVKKRKAKG
jgi:hypothetical protein